MSNLSRIEFIRSALTDALEKLDEVDKELRDLRSYKLKWIWRGDLDEHIEDPEAEAAVDNELLSVPEPIDDNEYCIPHYVDDISTERIYKGG